jgi:ribosomal protein S12 methylthiotransferase accessory factor
MSGAALSSESGAAARRRLRGSLRSPKLGMVPRLDTWCAPQGLPRVWIRSTRVASLQQLPGCGDPGPSGKADFVPQDGEDSLLLETVERSSCAFVEPRGLLFGSPSSAAYLDGGRMPLFTDAQFSAPGWPLRKLTGRSRLYWKPGRSLVTGETIFVPASLVYLPYRWRCADDAVAPSNSTGQACRWSLAEALLSGLLEVCERDAFALTWLRRLVRPRVRIPAGSALAGRVARALSGHTERLTWVDLSNDLGVPVTLAVLRWPWQGRWLVAVGLAARPTLYQACERAFLEACYEVTRLAVMMAERPIREPAPDFSDVVDWGDHGRVYAQARYQPALDFLTESTEERAITDLADQRPAERALEYLVDRVRTAGGDVVAVDLTTADARDLGLHVVKVFVPRAVPLNADHRMPFLGPERAGFSGTPDEAGRPNPFPHPFS